MNAADLTACELVQAYAARKLSRSRALEAVQARVEKYEPALMALWEQDFPGAMNVARDSERALAQGEPLEADRRRAGDDQEPRDEGRRHAARHGGDRPRSFCRRPAPPAAFPESGGLIFAQTTMPDYGMLSSLEISFHKLTHQPVGSRRRRAVRRAAQATAAAGYGPLHVGTDIGGSVRLPAGWCGIFT